LHFYIILVEKSMVETKIIEIHEEMRQILPTEQKIMHEKELEPLDIVHVERKLINYHDFIQIY